jgi:hypothetical protein
MNISLAFTTWKSADWIKQQLDRDYFNLSEGLIDEIIILDDCSEDYNILKGYETSNIKVYQNEVQLSPLLGRKHLVSKCKNDWVFLMDSDNFLLKESSNGVNCFDVIRNLSLSKDTIYCPGFINHFGYKNLCNKILDLNLIKAHFNDPSYYLKIFLNTGNFLVPRDNYVSVCEQIDTKYLHYTVDVIYFTYLWLSQHNFLHCVGDYEYHHTIRQDGFTNTHGDLSIDKLNEVYNMYNK